MLTVTQCKHVAQHIIVYLSMHNNMRQHETLVAFKKKNVYADGFILFYWHLSKSLDSSCSNVIVYSYASMPYVCHKTMVGQCLHAQFCNAFWTFLLSLTSRHKINQIKTEMESVNVKYPTLRTEKHRDPIPLLLMPRHSAPEALCSIYLL